MRARLPVPSWQYFGPPPSQRKRFIRETESPQSSAASRTDRIFIASRFCIIATLLLKVAAVFSNGRVGSDRRSSRLLYFPDRSLPSSLSASAADAAFSCRKKTSRTPSSVSPTCAPTLENTSGRTLLGLTSGSVARRLRYCRSTSMAMRRLLAFGRRPLFWSVPSILLNSASGSADASNRKPMLLTRWTAFAGCCLLCRLQCPPP